MRLPGWALVPLLLVLLPQGCGLIHPPPEPRPELLRCFSLETDLPRSYSDSLGYQIPPVIRLVFTSEGQWMVLPTDQEWHPSWTVYDELPSGASRVAHAIHSAPASQHDSIRMIPGDSIDISFPSDFGRLVFRVGPDGGRLRGRAEWVIHSKLSFLNEGTSVVASPTSCDRLPRALVRTRYR